MAPGRILQDSFLLAAFVFLIDSKEDHKKSKTLALWKSSAGVDLGVDLVSKEHICYAT